MSFAFIFESVGGTEWFVLLGVILIVVGPKNLPSAARKLGQIMANLRRAADEFKRQLMSMDQEVRSAVNDAIADNSSDSSSSALRSSSSRTSSRLSSFSISPNSWLGISESSSTSGMISSIPLTESISPILLVSTGSAFSSSCSSGRLLLLFISFRQKMQTSRPGRAGSSLQMLHSSTSSVFFSPFSSRRQTLQYFSSSRM